MVGDFVFLNRDILHYTVGSLHLDFLAQRRWVHSEPWLKDGQPSLRTF